MVTITHGFWLANCEVTLRQFQEVTGRAPSRQYPDTRPDRTDPSYASWKQAMTFCDALTGQLRETGELPEGFMCRLPTEAEWEYACRAGTDTPFSFGEDTDQSTLPAYEWYRANSQGAPQPVGQKRPNPWGLFDMHGNVHEWCLDCLGTAYPGGA